MHAQPIDRRRADTQGGRLVLRRALAPLLSAAFGTPPRVSCLFPQGEALRLVGRARAEILGVLGHVGRIRAGARGGRWVDRHGGDRADVRPVSRSSVRSFPQPETMRRGVFGSCKWCGLEILERNGKRSTRRYWHPWCTEIFFLYTKLENQRDFLIGRDGERCCDCGVERPMKWRRGPPVRTLRPSWTRADDEWAQELWSSEELRAGRQEDFVHLSAEERIERVRRNYWLLDGCHCSIERVSALEVDHEIPLWKVEHLPPETRRRYFGPENLRLRCPDCHKVKTAREAAERAVARRLARG